MNVQHPQRSTYPAVIPSEQTLPVSPARKTVLAPSPWAAGEIIDCVEINSENVPLTPQRQATYPVRADHPPPAKGQWIDIWI